MKRIMALFCTLFFCVFINTADIHAIEATDIPSGHWAKEAIENLAEHDIMQGYQGLFRPNDPITRAEYCTLVNRAFGYIKRAEESPFKDVKGDSDHWKDTAMMVASYHGYLKGSDGYAYPERPITREEAIVMLSRVIKQDPVSEKTSFLDDKEIASWAKPNVSAMQKSGYIQGSGGRLKPKAFLTRGEAAQLLYNCLGELLDRDTLYDMKNTVLGNVTVSAPGVILKNAVIKGDLFITEGVGDGTVTLENVKVEGRTVVSGGGLHSFIVINTDLGSVRIEVPDGAPVRFAMQGSSTVDTFMVLSDSVIDASGVETGIPQTIIALPEGASVDLIGSFSTVEVENTSASVNVQGSVEQLVIASTALDTQIHLSSSSYVGSLLCDAQSHITGSGRIRSATVNVRDVVFERRPERLTMPKGVTAMVSGEEIKTGYGEETKVVMEGGGTSQDPEPVVTYTLSVASNPQNLASIAGGGLYTEGSTATLTATPVSGWGFKNWTVDGVIVGTKPKLLFVMPKKDVTVTANLVQLYSLTVTASPSAGGDVTPKEGKQLAANTIFTVTAKPKTGYIFSHWEMDHEIISTEESLTYFMPYGPCSLSAVFLPEGTMNIWDGSVFPTDGIPVAIKDGSYLISTGSQLAWIAEKVRSGEDFEKKTFVLQNNIDMNYLPWIPIGDLNHAFNGTFNGNGKVIFNLTVDADSGSDESTLLGGLFGHVGQKGKVQKVTLKNIHIEASFSDQQTEESFCYAAGIAAINSGQITGCQVVNGTVEAKNAEYNFAGGITAYNMNKGKIKGCYNLATVKTDQTAGSDGAAGGIAAQSIGTIENSFNEGSVRSIGADGSHAGGIVGYGHTNTCLIKDCFNNGSVETQGNTYSAAGGIVGSFSTVSKVYTCYNTGSVTAVLTEEETDATLKAAGGIIGCLPPDSSADMRSCYYMVGSAETGLGTDEEEAQGATAGSIESFRSQGFFLGFDFEKTWYFQPIGEYPYPHLQEFLKTFKLTCKALPSKNGKSGGTAEVMDNAGNKFMGGAIVPLRAVAEEGYTFLHWTVNGEIVSEQEEFNFLMPYSNTTIQANFVADISELYALYLDVNLLESGTVIGAGTYFAGDTVSLKATPFEGYEFERWVRLNDDGEYDEIGTEEELTYVMPSEDVHLIAVFSMILMSEDQYKMTVTVEPPEGGEVKAQSPSSQEGNGIKNGVILRFTAVPSSGYEFVKWTINGEESGTEPLLLLEAPSQDITITAHFRIIRYYSLSIESDDESKGTVQTDRGETELQVKEGEIIRLVATPKDGFTFGGWYKDGTLISDLPVFDFEMPALEGVTVYGHFEDIPTYTLRITENDAEMGTAGTYDGKSEVKIMEGEMISLYATPKEAYVFVDWTIDGKVVYYSEFFDYIMPAMDVTVTANFTEKDDSTLYTLNIEYNTNRGSVTIYPDTQTFTFPAGESIQLSARAYTGFTLEGWTVNGESVEIDDTFYYTMPPEDVDITINFARVAPEGTETSFTYASSQIYDFAYDGGNRYVGVGEEGSVIVSSDEGKTWVQAWSGINAEAVAYGNGRFIAVGRNGDMASSTDGLHWVSLNHLIPSENYIMDFIDIAYGTVGNRNMFIALDFYHVLTSYDGITWNDIDLNLTNGFARKLEIGNNQCLIVGLKTAICSTDGVTWQPCFDFDSVFGPTGNPDGVTYGNGIFVISASNKYGSYSMTSSDGVNWEYYAYKGVVDSTVVDMDERDPLFDRAEFFDLSYANGIFFGAYGGVYFTATEPPYFTEHLHDLIVLNGHVSRKTGKAVGNLLLCTGDYGQLVLSRDKGMTWEEAIPQNPHRITNRLQDEDVQIFSGSRLDFYHHDFGPVPQGVVITSSDNNSFTRYTLIPSDYDTENYGEISVVAGNGEIYVAVGGDTFLWPGHPDYYKRSVIYTSQDARNWYASDGSAPVPYILKDVVYNPKTDLFAAVGTDSLNGVILVSNDGNTWVNVASDMNLPELYAIGIDLEIGFIAGGRSKYLYVSSDGVEWKSIPMEIDDAMVTGIEGNRVIGGISEDGVYISKSFIGRVTAQSEFFRYMNYDDTLLCTALTLDDDGYAHIAFKGGRIGVFDNYFMIYPMTTIESLSNFRSIQVSDKDQTKGFQRWLYSDCGLSFSYQHEVCGCRSDQYRFSKGSGSVYDPFVIFDVTDFEHVRLHAENEYYYQLEADLVLPENTVPVGDPYAPFGGVFDGNGYTIYASWTSDQTDNDFYGLFGVVAGWGSVKNLNLNLTATLDIDPSRNKIIGGISGENYGTIQNCRVTVDIVLDLDSTELSIGGISGYNQGTVDYCGVYGKINVVNSGYMTLIGGISGENNGFITRSFNYADIDVESARFMSAGGIAGDNFRGVIRNCFNDSLLTVKGVGTDWSAGGIAGMNYEDAQIETSFNVGYFMASFLSEEDPGTPLPVGSISGMNEGTIAYCYYLEKTADMGVGTKDPDDDDNKVNTKQLSNQQMKTQESYIGFDFYRVWEIMDGKCPNFQSR